MNNFNLSHIPQRTSQPRQYGINMVMDKGLSYQESKNLIEVAGEYIDFVKLAFGTAMVTPNLSKKIALYRKHQIEVYFGGTLFEAFLIRKQFKDYVDYLKKYKLKWVEVSDGTIHLPLKEKCQYIRLLKEAGFRVISEVGSKDETHHMMPAGWIHSMREELAAGSEYVIGEAREAGNVGIFKASGGARHVLINKITQNIDPNKIIWETPQKNQQQFFINKLGANVNLGNIAPTEVIALESMRIGLRSDTFNKFL